MARPRSASEVIDRVSAIAELSTEDDERVVQAYFRHPPLVGRSETRARLHALLNRVRQRAGGSVLLEGGPGSGKSAQLADLEREARLSGLMVLSINARAYRAPMSACKALLERAALELAVASVANENAPRVASTPAESADDMCERLLALVRFHAVLLSIDDAEHLDSESAAVFAQLSKMIASAPMLLALTASSDDAQAQVGLRPMRRNATRVQLTPLGADDVEQLTRGIFGDVPGLKRLSSWLSVQGGGAPAAIMELLAEQLEKSAIRYQDGAWLLPQELVATWLKQ